MGTISGCISATCKECGNKYIWHMNNFPFVDAEIIGTCDDCFEKVDHDVVDEFQGVNGKVIGRKTFKS